MDTWAGRGSQAERAQLDFLGARPASPPRTPARSQGPTGAQRQQLSYPQSWGTSWAGGRPKETGATVPSAEEPRSGADGSSLNPRCGASSSLPISQTETLRLGEDTEHCRVRLTPSPACDVWATPSALALPALKGPSPKRRPRLLPSSSSPGRGVQTELLGRDLAASPGLPRPRPPICPQGPGGGPAEGGGQRL